MVATVYKNNTNELENTIYILIVILMRARPCHSSPKLLLLCITLPRGLVDHNQLLCAVLLRHAKIMEVEIDSRSKGYIYVHTLAQQTRRMQEEKVFKLLEYLIGTVDV